MVTAIVVAAGKSERMGAGTDKAFLSLVNKPVIAWSLLAFERCPDVDAIVLVVRKDQLVACKAVVQMFGISKIHAIVAGGARRQDSVLSGLKACDIDTRHVVIHDGARPCISPEEISEIVKAVKRSGAVTFGRKITDTVKRVDRGSVVVATEDRDKLWAVQTPQAFQIKILREAYKALGKADVTDDCLAVELNGGQVKIVENRRPNIKITTVEDLQIAGALLK
ncbi:MAG: 2-C-methyl-D-erythritol 4-phosphate cytidylyltransferase [Kiritimatiellae bacterium]|nr:2-C-methyl-D-erythritol 4-phosphate cytidylyltransferase [Kiritimatiellia bacterium]